MWLFAHLMACSAMNVIVVQMLKKEALMGTSAEEHVCTWVLLWPEPPNMVAMVTEYQTPCTKVLLSIPKQTIT